jgi:2-polyprenyl-6-methoxyphenol hydroxylase-like FAD-dependent oxidoreductase
MAPAHSLLLIIEKLNKKGKKANLFRTSFGYQTMAFERSELVQVLLDVLPHREEQMITGRKVAKIENHASGVTVHLDDGSQVKGSMVIAADGVWSGIRNELAKTSPDFEGMPYSARYKVLFGRGPNMKNLPTGNFIQRHDFANGVSTQIFQTAERCFFIIYSSHDEKTDKRSHFSDKDAEEYVNTIRQFPVLEDVTIGDVWNNKIAGGLSLLHQGIAKKWHQDRIVLLGDAAHKVRYVSSHITSSSFN